MCRTFFSSLLALLLLCSIALAQACSTNARIQIQDTGWVDVAPLTSYVTGEGSGAPTPTCAGVLDLGSRPASVVASFEFRVATLVENKYAQPIYSYVVGSGFNYQVGNAWSQLCLNQCGELANQLNGQPSVSLYPSDGITCTVPSPVPEVATGFNEHYDWHIIPTNMAQTYNLGTFGPGQHPITFDGYHSMQEWEHQPVLNPSHVYRCDPVRFQMRARLAIVR